MKLPYWNFIASDVHTHFSQEIKLPLLLLLTPSYYYNSSLSQLR